MLGQVRAQLRSCVFKVIDNQDQVEKRQSSFHFENPHARKMRDSQEATFVAELIREFLEFYNLNYSQAIFGPETNLKGKTPDRDGLANRVGIQSPQDKPILQQLIEMIQGGDFSAAPQPGAKADKQIEPLSMQSLPEVTNLVKHEDRLNKDTDLHLSQAQNLIDEYAREERSGF